MSIFRNLKEGELNSIKDISSSNISISTIRIPPNVMDIIIKNHNDGFPLHLDGEFLRSSNECWDLLRAKEALPNIDIIDNNHERIGTLSERISLKPSIHTISSTKDAIRRLDKEDEIRKENRRIISIDDAMITPTKTKPSSKVGSATKKVKVIPSRIPFLMERYKILNDAIDLRLKIFKDIEFKLSNTCANGGDDLKRTLFVLNVEEERLKFDSIFQGNKEELTRIVKELHECRGGSDLF